MTYLWCVRAHVGGILVHWRLQALLATRGLERPCEQCLERESDSVCKECCSVAETPFCNQCWEECHETGALSSHVRHFYAQGLRARLDRLKVWACACLPVRAVVRCQCCTRTVRGCYAAAWCHRR